MAVLLLSIERVHDTSGLHPFWERSTLSLEICLGAREVGNLFEAHTGTCKSVLLMPQVGDFTAKTAN